MTLHSKLATQACLALMAVGLLLAACQTQVGAPPTVSAPAATPPAATTSAVPAAPSLTPAAWDDRSIFRSGLVSSAQGVLQQLPGASVYHIDLTIAPDRVDLSGKEEVRYTNRTGTALDEVYFRLFPNLSGGSISVAALEVDGKRAASSLEQNDSALKVPLSPALQPGEAVIIGMDFSVKVPDSQGGNYNIFVYTNNVLTLSQFYPLIPAYDAHGWHIEIPPNFGDLTYSEVSFYQVHITAPAGLTVVTSGRVLQQDKSGDDQLLSVAAGPVRDFYVAASDRYTLVSARVGETIVNSYTFPEFAEGANLTLDFAKNAFASYGERFGAYPYTQFDIVSTPTEALGVEYPGVIALADSLYNLSPGSNGLPAQTYLEATTAHEIAHQWFYGVVGDDQVNQPWLDKSMAQYLTSLYYLDAHGSAASQSYMQNWYGRWSRVDSAQIPIGQPVGAYDEQSYSAIVYGRGPIFLDTLSKQMGAQEFDAFLKDYYLTYQWGIATTQDFQKLAEKDCACDLTGLFNQWVY